MAQSLSHAVHPNVEVSCGRRHDRPISVEGDSSHRLLVDGRVAVQLAGVCEPEPRRPVASCAADERAAGRELDIREAAGYRKVVEAAAVGRREEDATVM